MLDVAAREGKPNDVEVQVIAVGDDTAWVSLPGEIFVELGLRIKQDSPFRNTIIAALTGVLCAIHPVWVLNTAEPNDGVLATFLLGLCLFLGARGGCRIDHGITAE